MRDIADADALASDVAALAGHFASAAPIEACDILADAMQTQTRGAKLSVLRILADRFVAQEGPAFRLDAIAEIGRPCP